MKYVLIFILLSCGYPVTEQKVVKTQVIESLDMIKQINQNDSNLLNQSRFKQDTYKINDQNRILIKFKTLHEAEERILASTDDRVFIDFKEVRSDSENLKLCSLDTNWTFHATWSMKSQRRSWNSDGADFNKLSCISPKNFNDVFIPESDLSDDDNIREHYLDSDSRIVFDITDTINARLKSGHQNLGWILINDVSESEIFGDGQALGSLGAPRLYWSESSTIQIITWKKLE